MSDFDILAILMWLATTFLTALALGYLFDAPLFRSTPDQENDNDRPDLP